MEATPLLGVTSTFLSSTVVTPTVVVVCCVVVVISCVVVVICCVVVISSSIPSSLLQLSVEQTSSVHGNGSLIGPHVPLDDADLHPLSLMTPSGPFIVLVIQYSCPCVHFLELRVVELVQNVSLPVPSSQE